MIDPNAIGRQLGGYKSAALRCGISVQEWIARQVGGQSRCFRCTLWKPQSEFSKDSSRTNGFASICKPCQSDASTASRYGLPLEALAELKSKPCAICERVRPIMVDHCHESGKVRSGLCQRCNAAIGLFADDPELMMKAISYLEKHRG